MRQSTRLMRAGLVIVLLVSLAVVEGAPPKKTAVKKTEPAKAAETVELFAAMAAKQVAVKFIPADATQARLFVSNQSDKPLAVEIPAAFAGTPILPVVEETYRAALAAQTPQTLGSVVQTEGPVYRSPGGKPLPSNNGDRPAEL